MADGCDVGGVNGEKEVTALPLFCPSNCKRLVSKAKKQGSRQVVLKYACRLTPIDHIRLRVDGNTGRVCCCDDCPRTASKASGCPGNAAV